jgi:hypothetical protein
VAGLAVGIGQGWRHQVQIAGIERDQAKAEAAATAGRLPVCRFSRFRKLACAGALRQVPEDLGQIILENIPAA